MKGRTSLAMIELTVMLLIFSLTAALCLQAFLWSDQTSRTSAERDEAVRLAQNAAELIKYSEGDFAVLEQLKELPAVERGDFSVTAQRTDGMQDGSDGMQDGSGSALKGLGSAVVEVRNCEGSLLFSLPVSWQEPLTGGELQ